MSSHREAPKISNDPVADNTDLYAFVSPDAADTVTIIANYIPLEEPAGGPNFFQFGDDVLYEIKIDNDGDSKEEITYQFRFKRQVLNRETFLYNTFPISLVDSTGAHPPYSDSFNIRQRFSVKRIKRGDDDGKTLGKNLATPPVNVGPRSTPMYADLANAAIHDLGGGRKVFCGQRNEAFFVDLGSIFDLGVLRPVQGAHALGSFGPSLGRDGTKGFNVHTIALQVPKTDLTRDGSNPTNPMDAKSVVGIWANASRRRVTVRRDEDDDDDDDDDGHGRWVQVSRLGMPLINEVIIPVGDKDRWNARQPKNDKKFLKYYEHPELQTLLPILYPGVFPKLAAFTGARADLVAILLSGIPSGIIPGFQNFTGTRLADMLRLNMAIPPGGTSSLGLLGGDAAGFPNGRRVFDDVVAIELLAIAGATLPLVTSYTPDTIVSTSPGLIDDGITSDPDGSPLGSFPYLDHPLSGYDHAHDSP